MNPFGVFDPLSVFRLASQGGEYARVPIALTAPDGTVFVNADGVVLTYGTKRIRLTEEPEA